MSLFCSDLRDVLDKESIAGVMIFNSATSRNRILVTLKNDCCKKKNNPQFATDTCKAPFET